MKRPRILLHGCYAFIALIILFLGQFYQGTLTEHLSTNPLTNSGVKLIKMEDLWSHWCRPSNHFFLAVECWSSFFFGRATTQGQDYELLLISILVLYLFPFL